MAEVGSSQHRAAWFIPPPHPGWFLFRGMWYILVPTVFLRLCIALSANQMVPTTGNDLHGSGLRKQHPAPFCPSLPHIQHLPRITTGRCFPLSKSSSFSATVSGTWKDQPTQLSHPVPPEPRGGFNSFSTSTHTCSPTHTPLLLTEPPALTAHLSLTSAGTGGCNITHFALWEHKRSHLALPIHARKSLLLSHPSFSPSLFYHYPPPLIMELIRDIFTLFGLGLKSN